MHPDRRTMIAGLTGLGFAALARPALAAAPLQDIIEVEADELGEGMGVEDGFSPTSIDLSGGGFGRACVLVSEAGASSGLLGCGLRQAQLPGLIRDGAAEGYRLRGLCVQEHALTVMALFQQGGGPAPESWHIGQTPAEYQALVSRAEREGLEPAAISVDNMDGAPRFTTLLRRSSTAWVARHGLKLEDLTPLTTALKARGFRLARTVPYLDAGQLRFASLYRPAGRHGWQAWVGDADPSIRDREFRAQGFALLQAVSYDTSAGRRWSCVWQKAVGEAQDYFWGN